jgi:dCMP deaminase
MNKKLDIAHMISAIAYGHVSYCDKMKVGSILVTPDGRPLLSGYNGTDAGTDNCCEDVIACGTCGAAGSVIDDNELKECPDCRGKKYIFKTKSIVHHAERNLLGYANRYGISTNGCIMYVTLAPCIECAKSIVLAGISEVVYLEAYRVTDGIDYLKDRGVKVRHLNLPNDLMEPLSGILHALY